MAAPLTSQQMEKLLVGRKFWTERGYDNTIGEYVYTITIVLATGDAAIRDA